MMSEEPASVQEHRSPHLHVKHYEAHYGHFASPVYAEVRREAFGRDIGQNSWLTADELVRFVGWLELTPGSHILDVASGAGGPTLALAEMTECQVTGIDVDECGVTAANGMACERQLDHRVRFLLADASHALPFADATFDAVICIDAINHLRDRRKVLVEWHRVLRHDGRLLFTDPITVTGILGSDEIAIRSSIGYFLFTPEGTNKRLLDDLGSELLRQEDVTENVTAVARRWHDARDRRQEQLPGIEGAETFGGQQRFFEVAYQLAAERRLSRHVFLARKR